jgi:cytoskeletal protein CcmA (bactofilin family)
VIGATIKIKGEISGDENLLIEGSVVGSVALGGHDLTIGQNGDVEADLKAKTVKVEGQVTGDIHGEEKVIITKTGRVRGNITAPRVTLEDGAKFKGAIDMDPGVEKPVAVPARKPGNASSAQTDAVDGKGSQTAG